MIMRLLFYHLSYCLERGREEIWSYLDNLVTDRQTNGRIELILKSLSQLKSRCCCNLEKPNKIHNVKHMSKSDQSSHYDFDKSLEKDKYHPLSSLTSPVSSKRKQSTPSQKIVTPENHYNNPPHGLFPLLSSIIKDIKGLELMKDKEYDCMIVNTQSQPHTNDQELPNNTTNPLLKIFVSRVQFRLVVGPGPRLLRLQWGGWPSQWYQWRW